MSAFCTFDLKSNMDRFIGSLESALIYTLVYLKSNMDRFIDENNILNIPLTKTFKIQYG